MIIKKTDFKKCKNKFEEYGLKAEKQMSFYLDRSLKDREDIFILNDLRLEIDGDYAQIDHLVIYEYGFMVIESKSVTGTIKVNKYEEWIRIFKNNQQGMPSPIQQARRQLQFLHNFLKSNSDKKIYKSNILEKMHYDILIAISDNGIIEREIELEEICKADKIIEAMGDKYIIYQKEGGGIFSIKKNAKFDIKSMKNIAEFLLKSHVSKNTKIENKIEKVKIDKLTSSKMATKLKISTKDFMKKLADNGYIKTKDEKDYLTAKGKKIGGEERKGRFGKYFLWNDNMVF